MRPLLLDGPIGTCLGQQGIPLHPPLWSAHALIEAPEAVLALHKAYAAAGADIHTTNSFRCQPDRHPDWKALLQLSVDLAREGAQAGSRVAGALAPAADCYRPDLSPSDCLQTHTAVAEALAESGVDLILCETHPHPGEALLAVQAATRTGCETWLMLTAGPEGDLMDPHTLIDCATKAVEAGASLIGINCTAAVKLAPFVTALSSSGLPFGVSGNAGNEEDQMGWSTPAHEAARRYAEYAEAWHAQGALLIGSCCGTGPAHTKALRALLN